MDYSNFISVVADLVKDLFPYSLIFGLTAKLCNIAFCFIFNKKIDM